MVLLFEANCEFLFVDMVQADEVVDGVECQAGESLLLLTQEMLCPAAAQGFFA